MHDYKCPERLLAPEDVESVAIVEPDLLLPVEERHQATTSLESATERLRRMIQTD